MKISCLSGTLVVMLVITAAAWCEEPVNGPAMLEKKLIEYGWDVPMPDYIRANIREMEKKPFDGLVFKLKGGGNVLEPTPMAAAQFAEDYENVSNIAWEKFTDNFVVVWAASEQDWFNEEQWRVIEANTGLVTRAARLGRCVGICFDPEPYGKNPWNYAETAHMAEKSFDDYRVQARARGAQFMRAVQRELPNPQILSLYQFALFDDFCRPSDPVARAKALELHPYGLYPAFLNGMLDAAEPGATLTDGNENAYYYESTDRYYEAYHRMKQNALYLVDPALWPAYNKHARAGSALYVDQYFGLRADPVLGNKMTAEERPKWFEHNVYYALKTTDRYAWCYSERMNWWKGQDVPPGAEEAVRSARDKLSKGESLGFDLAPIVAEAKQRP
ncbi:MAG: hypothetical protein BWY09_00049 [Candidatus Hydrogenedentes bacterium ADurb.Bin179]|nr:MAG: hypothetical protein BWY09_00049 [Candidatus Hydrogenedentes bacterium ADurb.Bin179]